jgi:predicted dehydrogenase
MKRRDFLHLAIAGTAAASAQPLFARDQQTGAVGANNRIRTAIIGCGNRGRAVAREWIEHADTTFVAACDVDKSRTDATAAEFAQAGHKADGYEDYRRILERKDVDALLIATPDHWHSPMTIEAIAAGKDVYCEKPVSNTVEAAVGMRDAARKSNRIIQIGTQQRSWTHFVEAAKLFHDAYIGTTDRNTATSSSTWK